MIVTVGWMVSTLKVTLTECVFPALSSASTTTVCVPWSRAEKEWLAVMLSGENPSVSILYRKPARPEVRSLPVQLTNTVVDEELKPLDGEVMETLGSTVSTVNLMVSTAVLPAWSQACMSTVWASSLRPENW